METKAQSPLKVGNSVLIRTVTYFYTGHIVEISDKEIILKDAAWVADTGRFSNALVQGILSEVEPFPDIVSVARDSLVDVTLWKHPLPRETK